MSKIQAAAQRLDESNADDLIALITGVGIFVFTISPVLFVVSLNNSYNDRFSPPMLIAVRVTLGLATIVWWGVATVLLSVQQGSAAMLAGFLIGYAELKRDLTI